MRRPVTVLLLLCVLATACGDGGADGDDSDGGGAGATTTTAPASRAACGPIETEPLDPASSHHVLPGAPEPAYLTDPPTSGAHSSSRPGEGVVAAPLSRPEQVSVLEGGKALLQYDAAEIGDDDRRQLEALAGDNVTVAPNPDLPAPIVATAWTTKQTCSRLDVEALRRFAAEHSGADLHQ